MTKLHFDHAKLGSNYHGNNHDTIRGPKFVRVKPFVHPPSTCHRFILYFPSGAWWHLDVTFDRRGNKTARAK
jgi:hypothetical protein